MSDAYLMKGNKIALKSGFEAQPINDHYKAIYQLQLEKYIHSGNEALAKEVALLFTQLQQAKDYEARTGRPAARPDRIKRKEKKLKLLEESLTPKKETISYGGLTVDKNKLPKEYERLKLLKEAGEISKKRRIEAVERLRRGKPSDWWQNEQRGGI